MSDTKKFDSYKTRIKLAKKVKREAKGKRKSLLGETNPRALKLKSANEWHYN